MEDSRNIGGDPDQLKNKSEGVRGQGSTEQTQRTQPEHQGGPDEAWGSFGTVADPHREFARGAVIPNSVIISCDRVLTHTKHREHGCVWV